MNHRSNIDVLLVNYLLSRHSAVAHAAGEWARLWPLHHLVRMAGNYVVDREANDPLYRLVLKRYVQMSVANGIHLGVFPEGGLTRDGTIQPMSFGLLNYVVTASWPGQDRDVVFIPASFNYDRIPEQNKLVFSGRKEFRNRGKLYLALSSMRFILMLFAMPFKNRNDRFGWACASFGEPVSLKAWQRSRGVEFNSLSNKEKRDHIQALGHQLMGAVSDMIPVMPIHLLASVLLEEQNKAWSEGELFEQAKVLQNALDAAGAPIFQYEMDQQEAYSQAWHTLERLQVIETQADKTIQVLEDQIPMLQYYANSIGHYLDPNYAKTQIKQTGIESAEASHRGKKYLSLMLDSYDRVLQKSNQGKGFFDRFYELFINSSADVADKFKDTDMEQLKAHLQQSLEHVQGYFINRKPSERLRQIAQLHSKSGQGIEQTSYDGWLQCLINTVSEYVHKHLYK